MKKFFTFICLFFINILVISANDRFEVKFNKCIDGDTAKFVFKGDIITVRFLSINTPEIGNSNIDTEYYGYEASQYTCNILNNADTIELQYDPKSDKTDKYNRVLAWVFVDDILLQEKLVSEGYAEVKYVYDDYLYSKQLFELEKIAKNSNIGMWNNKKINDCYSNIFSVIIIIIIIVILYIYIYFKNKKNR